MIDLRRRDGGPVLRIGHRGAASLAPENTVRAMRAAVERAVDLVEFDVLDLPRGPLVLAHSDRLEEVSHGAAAGSVRARSLDELCAALARFGVEGRTVVSSFHVPTLREVARRAPSVGIGFTFPEDRLGVSHRPRLQPLVGRGLAAARTVVPRLLPRMVARAGAGALMLQHRLVTSSGVRRMHALGVPVLAWTVDEPEELERVVAAGVDGVITNDPRIFDRSR